MPGEVTQLLAELRNGSADAESRLAVLVYDELHRIAVRQMGRERQNHSLQASILVHEAYLGLVGQHEQNWQNRAHFFAVASQYMRRLLVDHARKRNAVKRGGGLEPLQLEDAFVFTDSKCDELIAVDRALERLAAIDPRQCRIVEMRFFAGLTEDEIAAALGVSSRTVKREWNVAKAWLHGEFSNVNTHDNPSVGADQGTHR